MLLIFLMAKRTMTTEYQTYYDRWVKRILIEKEKENILILGNRHDRSISIRPSKISKTGTQTITEGL
jgi:hypothetical protein